MKSGHLGSQAQVAFKPKIKTDVSVFFFSVYCDESLWISKVRFPIINLAVCI